MNHFSEASGSLAMLEIFNAKLTSRASSPPNSDKTPRGLSGVLGHRLFTAKSKSVPFSFSILNENEKNLLYVEWI